MARELRERLAEEPRPERAVMALNHYLFQEQGFRGNTEAYYDPRNSYLNEVLDRRTGIPITLSTVYIEVAPPGGPARRGGGPARALHRAGERAAAGRVLIDPFHGGALLSEKECQERLDRIFGGRVKVEARMLERLRPQGDDRAHAPQPEGHLREGRGLLRARSRAVELLLRLDPGNAEDLRDRGVLYAALDCYGLAVARPRGLPRPRPASPRDGGARGARRGAAAEGRPPELTVMGTTMIPGKIMKKEGVRS